MVKILKIGAMLVIAAVYSSPSISGAAKNVKCNGCVGTKDIKNNAVNGAKIRNGSVSTEDLSPELQGDIVALGIDIAILESQPRAKVGFAVPDNNFDRSNGHPFGTIYIQLGTSDVFISRESAIGAAIWEQLTPKRYAIGDVGPAGGWVFKVTADGLHGFEAAPVDLPLTNWGCDGVNVPGASGTGVGRGARNTGDILTGCSEADNAADSAVAYTLNGYTDWFLPSKVELNEMYLNIGPGSVTIGDVGSLGAGSGFYWSSSQFVGGGLGFAWFIFAGAANQVPQVQAKSLNMLVRAVRAF